jgi:HSP20 family molecular chaperone IbpA
MFDMIRPSSIWDDMFRMADALTLYPAKERSLENNGLKRLISRPHNIVNVKDKDGNITAQRLEVVTTPFKKNEVNVTIDANNMLTVDCGTKEEVEEKSEKEEPETYIYKGISTQNYTFSIKMGDNVDKDAIKAKNEDGVLVVTLPFKKKEDEPKQITNIEVE